MRIFGQKHDHSSTDHAPTAAQTPFTATFTKTDTSALDTPSSSRLLNLPGELRNEIYTHVARTQDALRLSEGQIILPALGGVCKKIRAEMRGIFEQEVVSNITMDIDIEARVVNLNFDPLFKWLDENDQRSTEDQKQNARVLKIFVTCRPELPGGEFPNLDQRFWDRSEVKAKENMPHLLLGNLSATLEGWTFADKAFHRTSTGSHNSGPQRDIRSIGGVRYHVHPRCKRSSTGCHYYVGFIADTTWRDQDFNPFRSPETPLSGHDLFATTYRYDREGHRTDRKLALMLLQACESDCSKAARDNVATGDDENLKNLLQQVEHEALVMTPFLKWTFYIVNRAIDRAAQRVKEIDEDQYQIRKILRQQTTETYLRDQESRAKRKRKHEEADVISSDNIRKRGEWSRSLGERKVDRDGTEAKGREVLDLMAGLHL